MMSPSFLAVSAATEGVAVANIDSPTELNGQAGVTIGDRKVAYQVAAGDNVYTVYYYDASDTSGASTPYVMAASGSGFWIAAGGKYNNSPFKLRSTLDAAGAATFTSTLDVTGAITGSSTVQGTRLISTIATGTAPLTVTSTTAVANLNASLLLGNTWASPGAIGGTTPGSGAFTTVSASGAITSTLATGTAPFTVASTTAVANLNASLLLGSTWAIPGTIGSTTANTGAFTTLSATGTSTLAAVNASGALSLTSGSNHNITQGTGWIWTSTGLAGGTIRGGIFAQSGGTLNLFGGAAIASQLTISSAGEVFINAATSATSLTVSGANAQWSQIINGGNTVGSSYGLAINAGTNASDLCLSVGTSGASANYLTIRGDGLTTFGGNVTITNASLPTLTINNTTTAASSWALTHLANGNLQLVQPSQNTWVTFAHASGTITSLGPVRITDSTASVGVSSGALVIGSGTTGGLGVCGSANIGGTLNVGGAMSVASFSATSLTVTGTSTLAAVNATSIGATTTGTGAFTTLSASSTSTVAAVNASGSVTLSNTSASPALIIDDGGAGGGGNRTISLTNTGSSLKTNWRLGAQITVNNGFEIGHSTVAGGSTYTTDLTIDSAGAVAIAQTLAVTGLATLTGGATAAAAIRRNATLSSDVCFSTYYTSSNLAFFIAADGTLNWGPSTAAVDTTLTRISPGLLELAGGLTMTTTLAVTGTSTMAAINASGPLVATSPAAPSQFLTSDAATNSAPSVFQYGHLTSGTPIAAFGAEVDCLLHSSNNTRRAAFSAVTTWVVATDASRTARTQFYSLDTGFRECIRIEASGSAPMCSFFGANAVVQPTGTTDLRTALINLGLYASGGATPLDLNGGTLTANHTNIGGGSDLADAALGISGFGSANAGTGSALQINAVSNVGNATLAIGAKILIKTPASGTTAAVTGLYCQSNTPGSGATITRAIGAWIDPQSGSASNNCGIYLSTTNPPAYVGNYAIICDSTAKSTFAGKILLSNPQGGFGYMSGAGGVVTQATSKSTSVTLNFMCGLITMNGAALAANTSVAFSLISGGIENTDYVLVQHDNTGTIGAYNVCAVPAGIGGAVTITVRNMTAGSLSEAIVLRFAVIKSAIS